jgi:hypothetical protein
MSLDVLELALLCAGWIVAFLLGKELQGVYVQWRSRDDETRRR